jgi:nickel/cobalt exporter
MRWRLALFLWLMPVATLAQSPFGPKPGAAMPPPAGITAWLLQQQAQFHLALSKAIGAVESSPSAFVYLLGLAFAYGVIHAVGPGHGKAVIAAYLVSSERAAKRGIALAFGAALVQALIALGLVGVMAVLLGGTGAQMERMAETVAQAGYALIAAMGLYVVWGKSRALLGLAPAACAPGCGHDHGPVSENAPVSHLMLAAIGAGIRPCTGAIILLVFALSRGLYLAGVAAVAMMALGTAIGTSAFAALALKAKALSLNLISGRGHGFTRFVLALEALAGAALAMLGILLLSGTMAGYG